MADFVPASASDSAFGVPAVIPQQRDNSRFNAKEYGFSRARAIALAQAAALLQGAVRVAHQQIVNRDHPNSFSLVEVVQFYQTGQNIVRRIAYRYMDDVAQFALQTLRDHSPVGSGDDPHPGLYRDGHMLFIDGHSAKDATNWQPGQVLFISNPEPYARKIELGTMKISVPPHVYEECAPIIAAKFPDVSVKFLFMPLRFSSVDAYAQSAAGIAAGHRRGGSQRAIRDWLVRQPALQIEAK